MENISRSRASKDYRSGLSLVALLSTALMASILLLSLITPASANEFRIAIMQDQSGDAELYKSLLSYLKSKGIEATFVTAKDYPNAVDLFANGKVEGMFSGSGIAGFMLIKGVAYPIVRPLDNDGNSTYWAVVLAPKGSAAFTEQASYFKGKRVAFCSLASAGEFFFKSIKGSDKAVSSVTKSPSHGAAIESLAHGQVDIAIVKNHVWEAAKAKYPSIVQVGEDKGENPDRTFIVSKKADRKVTQKVQELLLGLQSDSSDKAEAVKRALKVKGFIRTTIEDFNHTTKLLQRAGVDKGFSFK